MVWGAQRVVVAVVAALLIGAGTAPAALGDSSPPTNATTFPALLAVGAQHSCGILSAGSLSCWGDGANRRLGYGNTQDVADGIGPSLSQAGPVPIDGSPTAVAAGDEHTCALLETGSVTCWGAGAGTVPSGLAATAIAAGGSSTCAVLDSGEVDCWGQGVDAHSISLPSAAVDVGVSDAQSCAVLDDGAVDCWGTSTVASAVALDDTAQQVAVGSAYACALLDGGDVSCWTSGAAPKTVDLTESAVDVSVGGNRACAIDVDQSVVCWTQDAEPAAVGVSAVALAVGVDHVCTVTTANSLDCWGDGAYGKLGYGDVVSRQPNGQPLAAVSVQSEIQRTTVTLGGTTQAAAKAAAQGIASTGSGVSRWMWLLLPVALVLGAGIYYARRHTMRVSA